MRAITNADFVDDVCFQLWRMFPDGVGYKHMSILLCLHFQGVEVLRFDVGWWIMPLEEAEPRLAEFGYQYEETWFGEYVTHPTKPWYSIWVGWKKHHHQTGRFDKDGTDAH